MCINNQTLSVTFIAVAFNSVACSRAVEPAPVLPAEPAYFTGYQFQPQPVSSSQTLVKVSLCTAQEPTDLELAVYTFGPDTNADEALDQVLHPGSVPITPTALVPIRAKYTDSAGTRLSDYDQEKQFRIPVDRNAVSVLTTRTADGTLWTGQVITTNQLVGNVCLQRSVNGGRSGTAHGQKQSETDYVFSVWDVGDRKSLTPRLRAEVWFMDTGLTEEVIRRFSIDDRTGEIDLDALPPPHQVFRIDPTDYDAEQSFRLSAEVADRLVVLWHFVDANPKAAQRYRMQLGIYPPAPDDQQQRYNLMVDQFRAGL